MIDKQVREKLNEFEADKLARVSDLGAHYNFQSSVPTLDRYHSFLKEIVEGNTSLLTKEEIDTVTRRVDELMKLKDDIERFNPTASNSASLHQDLLNRIENAWQTGARELRPIHSFVRIEAQELKDTLRKAEETLKRITQVEKTIESTRKQIENLPQQTEQKFNDSYRQLQERLTTNEKNLSQQIEASRKELNQDVQSATEDARLKAEDVKKRLQNITQEADQKIDEVMQQARKFSAKSALSTYAEMFSHEAEENRKEVYWWRIILVFLSLLEIVAALSLFFYFLPEVLEITKNYGEDLIGIGWLISIFFVKIFILSIIAVGINHAIKNLNALSNQYSTNRFKANSLASFQAFLDATDNDKVVDNIIMRVSEAVYTHHVSGYLSKDDSTMKAIDPETLRSVFKLSE